jgi:hypothetical protein
MVTSNQERRTLRARHGVLLLGIATLAASCAAQAGDFGVLGDAVRASKLIIDARLRLEDVDQEPFADQADALTLRSRLGFETGKAWQTALLVEGEFVWPLVTDYNSTINGKTAYPTVSDPRSHEINRLQLTNTALVQTTVTLGRQRINLDDQRFIGNSGWRQNEQTFDSLQVVNKSVPNLTLDAAYITQVNRVLGPDSPQGRYQGDSYLGNVSYQLPVGRLTVFGYWLQFDPIAAVPAAVRDSSETLGVRFAGEKPWHEFKLAYAASYAEQQQYGANPLRFDNHYSLLELTGTYRMWSLGVGSETLAGNGVKGFTTPLASLHKFQGWADKFTVTPADGIVDRYLTAGISAQRFGWIDAWSAQANYHAYQAQRVSLDYGTEVGVQLQGKWHRFTGNVKYAHYTADRLLTDTSKFWVQLEYQW